MLRVRLFLESHQIDVASVGKRVVALAVARVAVLLGLEVEQLVKLSLEWPFESFEVDVKSQDSRLGV